MLLQIEEQPKNNHLTLTDGSSLQPRFDAPNNHSPILHRSEAEERPHARPSAIARQSREASIRMGLQMDDRRLRPIYVYIYVQYMEKGSYQMPSFH